MYRQRVLLSSSGVGTRHGLPGGEIFFLYVFKTFSEGHSVFRTVAGHFIFGFNVISTCTISNVLAVSLF